ncbi:MAG: DUF5131 family protein [Eubacteriales bacterium]|nr:DUF5131 family protein [Eubacteriales bacterium]MDD4104680.1 DUF5131 family protein [Eubacteriales bacterium]MDD4710591.1 DUF5131 family protein [Eubacteriales bacterium]NLO14731.1 DUF5131 family protein [Clostridiales bacterium]
MAMWSPWRGCHRYSEGCKYCYIHKGDLKRGADTETIVRAENFDAPVMRRKSGEYKMKAGQTVYLCFQTDFLLPDADAWRGECWDIIRERSDLHFLFLTKRIERFAKCAPPDWGEGYENVTVGCTVENQRTADVRLSVLAHLKIKHKNIIAQPLIERIDIEQHLTNVELVVVGGESDRNARPLDYTWVLDIREQCRRADTHFEFRQCGTHFIKDGKQYTLQVRDLTGQAKKAELNF